MALSNRLSEFTPWDYVVDKNDFIIDNVSNKKHQNYSQTIEDSPQHQKTQPFLPQVQNNPPISRQIILGAVKSKIIRNVNLSERKIDTQHPKSQRKKSFAWIVPIPKSNITIKISEDIPAKTHKISLQKIGVKHVVKATTNRMAANSPKRQQKDIRQDFKRLVPIKLIRKVSYESSLQKKGSSEHKNTKNSTGEGQIKKCALKNIQIYQQQKQTKTEIKIITNKVKTQQHILDRLLTRLE